MRSLQTAYGGMRYGVNASAITCSVYVGGEFEKETIENLSKLVDDGEKYGLPVLRLLAVGKDHGRERAVPGIASTDMR